MKSSRIRNTDLVVVLRWSIYNSFHRKRHASGDRHQQASSDESSPGKKVVRLEEPVATDRTDSIVVRNQQAAALTQEMEQLRKEFSDRMEQLERRLPKSWWRMWRHSVSCVKRGNRNDVCAQILADVTSFCIMCREEIETMFVHRSWRMWRI
jgi:hypothetical protein